MYIYIFFIMNYIILWRVEYYLNVLLTCSCNFQHKLPVISGTRSESPSDQREYKFPCCDMGIFRSSGSGLRNDRTDLLLEAFL